MICPNCKHSGNLLKRVFVKRKGLYNRYCVYCNAEVKIVYNWRKIFLLSLIVVAVLLLLHIILILIGLPGLSSGLAGGAAGAAIAIFMRKPSYVKIEMLTKPGKKRRN